VVVASYPLLSQAPTPVEVELGCDNKPTKAKPTKTTPTNKKPTKTKPTKTIPKSNGPRVPV
jgi:hypothetical protein